MIGSAIVSLKVKQEITCWNSGAISNVIDAFPQKNHLALRVDLQGENTMSKAS